MPFHFDKFQGTGNDFIIADDFHENFPVNDKQWIQHLCKRKFGIGADGLILLQPHPETDYRMMYFNADGHESTMCGNGGRCIAQFAYEKGYAGLKQTFTAVDGPHEAIMKEDTVALSMRPVNEPYHYQEGYHWLDTGSPHIVYFEKYNQEIDVKHKGRSIQSNVQYNKQGINVNFATILGDNAINVRTYERGVEDETLSCGTGVVASAIAYYFQEKDDSPNNALVEVKTLGGTLRVHFQVASSNLIENIWLEGPVAHLFHGIFRN